MPQKDFIIWLTGAVYIAVDFVTVSGTITLFKVRLMWVTDEGEFNVARYDTAHGTPHLDVNGRRKGQLRKEWRAGFSPEQVLTTAIQDFRQNYESYIAEFIDN